MPWIYVSSCNWQFKVFHLSLSQNSIKVFPTGNIRSKVFLMLTRPAIFYHLIQIIMLAFNKVECKSNNKCQDRLAAYLKRFTIMSGSSVRTDWLCIFVIELSKITNCLKSDESRPLKYDVNTIVRITTAIATKSWKNFSKTKHFASYGMMNGTLGIYGFFWKM